jgi:hypothetical protein
VRDAQYLISLLIAGHPSLPFPFLSFTM